MHPKPRFARLGRPTLYALIAVMLLPLLFSATAPQAAASPDYSPTIENISSSEAIIDRDLDYAGSGATTSTVITVRAQDNDGYGEISAPWIIVLDNDDNVVADVQLTDNTVIDENTLDFTYSYNPADNLSDSALGTFDVRASVENAAGFETVDGWTYSEDEYGGSAGGLSGSLSTTWKTEGDYSYKFSCGDVGDLYDNGAYAKVSGYVNYTNVDNIYLDVKWPAMGAASGWYFEIIVDGATVYSQQMVTALEDTIEVDVSALSGALSTEIGVFVHTANGTELWDVYFDFLRGSPNSIVFYHAVKTSLFTVDDLTTTINFDPTNPHMGWDLTVSGTHSRVVGSVSIDASWLIDNKHGQFSLGASDTYNQICVISNAAENENVGVTLRALDSPLDGATTSSYKVNENIKFQVWVRFEENYALAGWIPDENRDIDLLFEWGGGTYPCTLTTNPENITIPSEGAPIKIVKLTDNDDYWRYFIPPYSGGNLNFIIVDDISGVEQYRFYLQDYTAQYIPPNGQLLIKSWIGTNLAEINGDYWRADWRTTAWLVTVTQYQIWVRADDAPLRLVGPIDAVNPTDEKTIVVQVIIENVAPIFDYVYWNAWRVDNNIIRVEYRDNLDNTIEAHVAIFDENGVQQIEYQPDNEWFITTWLGADGAESYEVVLTVQHGEYGNFVMTMPIGSLEGPPVVDGISEPWGLPSGLTLSALGSVILVFIVGLSFDALRVQMGMLAMALTVMFCWTMGFLPLPGPYGGSFTAVLILVMAVLFALTWRRGK